MKYVVNYEKNNKDTLFYTGSASAGSRDRFADPDSISLLRQDRGDPRSDGGAGCGACNGGNTGAHAGTHTGTDPGTDTGTDAGTAT